jgi:putative tricarboxylic transport membrane protein
MSETTTDKLKSVFTKKFARSLSGISFFFIVACYLYVLAGSIDQNPIPGQLGPAFWPKCILILLMLSCVFKGFEIYREELKKSRKAHPVGYRHAAKESESSAVAKAAEEVAQAEAAGAFASVDLRKLLLMITACIGYAFFIDMIGFAMANVIFLFAFCYLVGDRKLMRLTLISILGTIGLLYLFAKFVYIPLPKGHFFFEDITLIIYRILFIIH